jgi:16S rRNA (cytosine967-C5)-methyltransferase
VTTLDFAGGRHFFEFLAHKPHLRLAPEAGKAFIRPVLSESPRALAAQTLLKREHGDTYTETLLEKGLEQSRLSPADRGLCRELVFGCVRWQAALDWLIARRTEGREQKTALRVLLRLGLYQMLWLERIPPHAAVNESVKLAREFGCGAQAGFANALLRGYARELSVTRDCLSDLRSHQPALGWSHPDWLVARWTRQFGAEATRDLLQWNNTPAEVFGRLNTLKTDAGKLLERWRAEGVEYDFLRRGWLPDNLVFRLRAHPVLARCRSFQDGCFYVQDPSTLLAPVLLDPQPGETVLDLCAAPGGKTTFMAQMMNNEGRILACDPAEQRLNLLRDNCARLGVSCVEPVALAPGSVLPAALRSLQFDRVLIDAPCSNTGVMRRRVDLRYRIRVEEIPRLSSTQLELLHLASRTVRPGGCMVYSTCSLEPEENGELVKRFLDETRGFELEDEQALVPPRDGVDGAYAAVLKRRA